MAGERGRGADSLERGRRVKCVKLRWQGRWGLALVVVVTAVALIWQSSRPAAAQGGAWSQPRLVFETDGTINYPTVVTDPFGQVHAFWVVLPSEADPGPNQLYYTRLDRPDWKPVDIFVSNESFTELAGIANTQRIALFWHGDTYTWAGVSPSASAQDWQPPTALHDALPGAGLALAPDGAVWMAYAVPSIQAMYVRRLDPASAQWEDPHWVANVTRVQRVPNAVRVAVGADNSLHVVWAEYQAPDGWPPLGLYYTNSTDQGLTWLPPQQAADTGFNQPNVATGPNAQVYLTWVGMVGVGGKYFQESGDAGRTWGRVEQISLSETLGGSEGAPHILVDAVGDLHVVYAQSKCVWYTSRQGGSWTWPLCISANVPGEISNIESPSMALGLGNQLHVFFWFNKKQLWYTSRTLTIEGQAPLPIPTPTADPARLAPTPTRSPTATPTVIPVYEFDRGAPPPPKGWQQSGATGLVFGMVPVLILLVAMVQVQRMRRRH